MAKRNVRRVGNWSYKKLGDKLPNIATIVLNQLGNRVNKAIQDGLDKGMDINDKPFASLSKKTTIPQRLAAGTGTKKLVQTGNMRKTKKIPATAAKNVFIIENVPNIGKNDKKVPYGAYHNEGFVNSSGSRYPGTRVPKRRWFGVPKSMRAGGKDLKKFTLFFKSLIIKAVRSR